MRNPPPLSAVPHRFLHREIVRHPSAILFVTQLLGVVFYAVDDATSSAPGWQVALELFGAGVLALAIWAVRDQPGPTWIAVILGVAASGLSVLGLVVGSDAIGLVSDLVHAAFYVFAATSMLSYMLSDADVTHDELWAVGATFTLVAWAFTSSRSCSRWCRAASPRRSTRTHRAPGSSCCSSASRTCRAPGSPTSCRCGRSPGRW